MAESKRDKVVSIAKASLAHGDRDTDEDVRQGKILVQNGQTNSSKRVAIAALFSTRPTNETQEGDFS